MALSEFDLIAQYFRTLPSPDIALGIGDDAAIVNVPANQQLLVTTDTLNCGVHFPEQTSAADIAYKSVAVNVSDLAAMGATPKWATLNLTLPSVDEAWLQSFASTLQQQLTAFGVNLIGGDTTRGPLSITLTLMGLVDNDAALRRDAAQINDLIIVTGTLGDARLGLAIALKAMQLDHAAQRDYLLQRLNRPSARLLHSQLIRSYAHAAIDISDGLAQDLSHILKRSNLGAVIDVEKLPLSFALRFVLDEKTAWQYALSGGDDYELLFTVSPDKWLAVEPLLFSHGLTATVIGRVQEEQTLQLRLNGQPVQFDRAGFQHF